MGSRDWGGRDLSTVALELGFLVGFLVPIYADVGSHPADASVKILPVGQFESDWAMAYYLGRIFISSQ